MENIVYLPIEDLVEYAEHPYKVLDNDDMRELAKSIKEYGVLEPLIVRPLDDNQYEILSGHRRRMAADIAGQKTLPAIITNQSDIDAAIMVVDSNLHRENILPSERAYAYRLKYEAQKCQGKRNDLTSGTEFRKFDKSERQIRYYIRLTNLIDALLDNVDEGSISIKAGAELSYLNVLSQSMVNDFIEKELCPVSETQAKQIKELYIKKQLCEYELRKVLCNGIEKERVYLETKKLKSYFPSNYSMQQCKDEVWKILDKWFEKR